MKIVLDARCMEKKAQAHSYLKEKLELPDYYGSNLDALYDCLTELSDTEVLIEHIGEDVGYFLRVYQVFLSASARNPELIVRVKKMC